MLNPCKLILTRLAGHGAMLWPPHPAIQLWPGSRPGHVHGRLFRRLELGEQKEFLLEEHKGHVLVMGAVNAIGEMARRVCNGDGGLFMRIRLSDIT